jgi:hypothetical protein
METRQEFNQHKINGSERLCKETHSEGLVRVDPGMEVELVAAFDREGLIVGVDGAIAHVSRHLTQLADVAATATQSHPTKHRSTQ